ncbi:hypothetical protein CIG75_06330 [Tumebacillus algifaecis]|uniref:RsgI N-terminal anti-sigma domain-containing protein n=1 Tax=Tumebacillus algifaecis TaxID=1214604 RepID=A0A223CZ58_9BACL|nr:anti-sigma factor domain-containing protein [Tumebacillus algifaecis]ASS74622.1 hypothetical protein CIG75_06330 [Tumebacillus algifaecis]
MQNKGIVMQVADGMVVVMTKDATFLKIPWVDGMTIGQEVDVPNEVIHQKRSPIKAAPLPWYKKTFNTTLKKVGVVAASVLLAVSVWSSTVLFSEPIAYAYVTVDINPSIELSIDNHKQVVTATSLNDEGDLVLAGLTLKGMSVDEAVGKLAAVAHTKGYLDEKTDVIITASPAVAEEEMKADLDLVKVESELVAKVQSMAQNTGAEVSVEGLVVSKEVRDAAQEAGLSPGKYALYLAAMQSGLEVAIDEFKTESVSKVINKRGKELAEMLHDLKGGKQLDAWHREMAEKKVNQKEPTVEQRIVPSNMNHREQDKKTPPGLQKKEDNKNKMKQDDKNGKDQKSSQSDKSAKHDGNNSKAQPKKSSNEKGDDKQKGWNTPNQNWNVKSGYDQNKNKSWNNGNDQKDQKNNKDDQQKGKKKGD